MKKAILFILSIVIIFIVIILSKFYDYKEQYSKIEKFNLKYEQYLDKEVIGTDIATIINKAINDNEQAYIKKDKQGKYIQNDESSINIEVKITDILKEGKIYTMETLYNGGMAEFVQHYNNIKFKCAKTEYNSNGQVKYMLFEQIST